MDESLKELIKEKLDYESAKSIIDAMKQKVSEINELSLQLALIHKNFRVGFRTEEDYKLDKAYDSLNIVITLNVHGL